MARVAAVLRALWRLVVRDHRRLGSLIGNNLFLVFFLLQASAAFLALLVALVAFIPTGASAASKIPAERAGLWPLEVWEWIVVRAGALVMTPVVLLALTALFVYRGSRGAWELAAAMMGLQLAGAGLRRLAARLPVLQPLRWVPAGPGTIGQLIRKDLREMLSVLDPYIALLASVTTIVYRLTHPGALPAEGRTMIALVVAVLLGTYAQCLFGVEARSGFTRYLLLPLRGWQILLAKDIAYLLVMLVLTAGIDPEVGLSAGLVCLALGHDRSVRFPVVQQRWGLVGGALLPFGVLQVGASAAVAHLVVQRGLVFLAPCVAVWAGSLLLYGRRWERAWRDD